MTSTELVTDHLDFWHALRDRSGPTKPVPPPQGSLMEAGVRNVSNQCGFTANAAECTARQERPQSPPVRAMLETLKFDRRFDAAPLDVA